MSVKFVTETLLTARDQTKGAFASMLRNAKGVERQMRMVQKTADSFKGMGRSMAPATAALAALGGNALRMAEGFDDAMNTTQSKLLITADAMKPLRDMAKDLGSTTAFSASEAGQAMGFLAQAGYDTNKILATTPTALNLAAAAGLELAQAADIASNVMGAFQMDKVADPAVFEKNFQRVSDTLALVSAKANTSVEELAEAMKDGAPIAKGFGMSVEQTSAMVGMLANMGIKGSKSGVIMKNMLTNLSAPATGAQKVMQKLGLAQSDFFKKTEDGKLVFKGVPEMYDALAKSGAGATDIMDIFGKIAGPGMMSVMDSAKAIKELEQTLKQGGATAEMAKIRMQGLPGVIAGLKSAWEGANIAMVESGGFDGIIEGLKQGTAWLQKFAKANPEVLATIVKYGAVAAVAAPALMALGGTLASVAVISKTFAGAMALVTAASLPMVAGIVAVAGAGYLIYKNWDKISAFAQGVWWGVKESMLGVTEAVQPMIDAFVRVKDTIGEWLSPSGDVSKQAEALNNLTVKGVAFGRDFGRLVPLLGAMAAGLVGLKVIGVVSGAFAAATPALLMAGKALVPLAAGIKAVGLALVANPIGLAITGIAAAIAAGIAIWKNWDKIMGKLQDHFPGLHDFFEFTLPGAIDATIGPLKTLIEFAGRALKLVGQVVSTPLANALELGKGIFTDQTMRESMANINARNMQTAMGVVDFGRDAYSVMTADQRPTVPVMSDSSMNGRVDGKLEVVVRADSGTQVVRTSSEVKKQGIASGLDLGTSVIAP